MLFYLLKQTRRSSMFCCVFLLFIFPIITGLYFELSDFEKIHFIKDIPESTMVVGDYMCELKIKRTGSVKISSPGACVHVQIYNPNQKLIFSKFYGGKGKFSFQSHLSGEYYIDISLPPGLKYDDNIASRIHLRIRSGEESIDYVYMMKMEKLNALEMTYRQLIEQVKDIRKEQSYQREREVHFREMSEHISTCVFTFAISELCLFIIVSMLQTRHLKSFFKQKKLV